MISEVFEALARVCGGQGIALGAAVLEDVADHLRVKFEIRNLETFLHDVQGLGAEVTIDLHLVVGAEHGVFVRTPQGDWRLDSDTGSLRDVLPSIDVRDVWNTEELLEHLLEREIEIVGELYIDKSAWRVAVEASTGRSALIGYSESSFTRWLETRNWRQVAKELFARAGGLVLLFEWEGPALDLGDRLVIQRLAALPEIAVAPPPAEIKWPQAVDPEFVRAAHLLPLSTETRDWMRRLLGVGAICASELFAMASSSHAVREAGGLAPQWELDEKREVDSDGVEGILALVRWTSDEPTRVRLAIAWRVAGDRIADPLKGPSANSLLAAAEIAYESAIDAGVRLSLARQAELERSFRDIDSSVATSREAMTNAVDATVTRALAAVVASGIAAVTTDEFRGWFFVAAATLIAMYLLFQGTVGLASHKRDIRTRLTAFDLLVAQRGARLAEPLSGEIGGWAIELDRRVRVSRIGLVGLAVLVTAGGIVGGTIHRPSDPQNIQKCDSSIDEDQPSSPSSIGSKAHH